MGAARHALSAPVELRPTSTSRLGTWTRALFRRGAPRARMVAPRRIALGGVLAVEWGVDCPSGDVTSVHVTLVGQELSRQRMSARTGIYVVSTASAFTVLELARAAPPPGQRVAYGRGTVTVPASTITSFTGAYNEIAWSIVVAAEFASAAPLRESFPIAVVAGRRA